MNFVEENEKNSSKNDLKNNSKNEFYNINKQIKPIPQFSIFEDFDITNLELLSIKYKISLESILTKIIFFTFEDFERFNSFLIEDKNEIFLYKNWKTKIINNENVIFINDINKKSIKDIDSILLNKLNKNENNIDYSISLNFLNNVKFISNKWIDNEVVNIGIGRTYKKLVFEEGIYKNKFYKSISFQCDHRIIDGAYIANYLKNLKINSLDLINILKK